MFLCRVTNTIKCSTSTMQWVHTQNPMYINTSVHMFSCRRDKHNKLLTFKTQWVHTQNPMYINTSVHMFSCHHAKHNKLQDFHGAIGTYTKPKPHIYVHKAHIRKIVHMFSCRRDKHKMLEFTTVLQWVHTQNPNRPYVCTRHTYAKPYICTYTRSMAFCIV
jgi:hypothetical protein